MTPYLDQNDARGEVNLGNLTAPQWYNLRISAIQQNGGHLAGRVLLFHNINDRKHAEEMLAEARDQAMQASLMKSQLLTNVSHDLRNPLNTVMGYTEMLKEGTYGPLSNSQTAILDRILVSTQQVSTFVGDLLDQSLIDKGRLSLNLNSFRPVSLIDAVRSQVVEASQNKRLDLNFEIDPKLPSQIVGDSKRLQQIIVNLVTNSIKFTETGFINVRLLSSDSGHWVIEVIDSGRGIPPEAQSYIFEPFRRIEEAGEKKSPGAGLGLAIARHLVTMMSGTIQLESQVGFGSTFRVVLPYVHNMEPAAR
jgi:signal transduction histidine kinase